MTQTLRGDVIRNDNIAIGQLCGTENTIAVGVAPPAPWVENLNLGNTVSPYGVEKIAVGVSGPNPEVP